MTLPLCVFHGQCDDGFAAAWCVRKALGDGNVEFHAGSYAEPPPAVDGRNLILVDFSYKRPALEGMAQRAHSILVLDHHITARRELEGFGEPPSFSVWRHAAWEMPPLSGSLRTRCLFDMERSGAAITWDYLIGSPRPAFIEYIQDRDLLRQSLPGVDEFTIALRSYPQEFEVWDRLIEAGPDALIREGVSIQRYYRLRVEELKRHAYLARLGLDQCWIANAPYAFASEVAGELAECKGAEFGACYFEVAPDKWQYSLRSRRDFDVSRVAMRYGGGGHKNAAGFNVTGVRHVTIMPQPPMEAAA